MSPEFVGDEGPQSLHAPVARAAGAAVRWRATGLMGAKVVTLTRSLVLAWLLIPDDFGLFAIAFVPLDLMLGVTDVGMVQALVQREDVHPHDYDVAWTVGLLRALVISAVLLIAGSMIAALFGDLRATAIIRALALRPIIAATASIRVASLERDLRFRSLALIDLTTSGANTLLAIGLATWMGVWALVVGALGGALGMRWCRTSLLRTDRICRSIDRARARSWGSAVGYWPQECSRWSARACLSPPSLARSVPVHWGSTRLPRTWRWHPLPSSAR